MFLNYELVKTIEFSEISPGIQSNFFLALWIIFRLSVNDILEVSNIETLSTKNIGNTF